MRAFLFRVGLCLCFMLILGTRPLHAQEDVTETHDSLHNVVLPIVFYLPETSLGIGGTGILTWRKASQAPVNRPSVLIYSAAYTFKNQLLFYLPYEWYSRNQNIRLKGELGYYRYFYNFYGLGNASRKENLETYNVNFPRLEFSLSKTQDYHFYYGVGLKFDQFDITSIDSSGILAATRPTGVDGGRKFNLQFLLTWDYRDNILSSYTGFFAEFKYEFALPGVLSDFNYSFFSIDFRKFIPLRPQSILALRVLSRHASAGAPFFDQAYISSPGYGRGFSDRRYIDRNITTSQMEWRFPVKGRLSAVAFVSSSLVYSGAAFRLSDVALKNAYGTGLRYTLDKKERSRIRLDVARGDGEINVYFTSSEAF